jgi:phosphoadenosine phosphosulfate reductase
MSVDAAIDYQAQNVLFETATPEEIIQWSIEAYGEKLCMTTSFQLGGMVLIDMIAKIDKKLPILFIDTGFHFEETLKFRDDVMARYGINLITLHPLIDRETFKRFYGDDKLYDRNQTECCRLNKVEPMERALKGYTARIAALRRDASAERAKIKILETRTDGVTLVHPLANWTRAQTQEYLKANNVPQHPLHAQGYKTIGCSPTCCTQPVGENAPERAGRWTGTGKSECGLHMRGIRRPEQDFSI